MHSFPVLVLGFAVRFLSLYPASLPQLFHRCLPSAFASCLFRLSSAFFRPLPVHFQLLGFCFFLSQLPVSASQWLPQCFGSPFRSFRFPPSLPPGFPCFFSGFRYLAFCSFPFVLPGSAPAAAFPVLTFCFPFRSRFRFRSRSLALFSAFFRPLPS